MSRRRGPKPGHVRDMYECANPGCNRRLETEKYSVSVPSSGVAADRIHPVLEPSLPAFTLLCTCGHFTVVTPARPARPLGE
jgi:hypothetical protein